MTAFDIAILNFFKLFSFQQVLFPFTSILFDLVLIIFIPKTF